MFDSFLLLASLTCLEFIASNCATLCLFYGRKSMSAYYSPKSVSLDGQRPPVDDMKRGYKYLGIHVTPQKDIGKVIERVEKQA